MSVASTSAPRPSLGVAMTAVRDLAIAGAACGIAGVVAGGIGSRLAMRISAIAAPEARGMVTENGNLVGAVTLEGTVGLFVFASLGTAIFGAGAYAVTRSWLPRGASSRGLAFGTILLALMGSAVVDPGNADFVLLADRGLNVTMFSALFIAYGLIASEAVALLERRVPPARELSPLMWALAVVCTLPILPGLAGVALGFAPERGIPLVVAGVAMPVAAWLDRQGRGSRARAIALVATGVMLLVVGWSGAEYLQGVATIL